MTTILDQIVERKRQAVAADRLRAPLTGLERRLADLPPARDFRAALDRPGRIGFLCEVKKASPSAGVIRADFDPAAIARVYEANGADAISVLTDEPFFQGHLEHLRAVRSAVSVPVLRKEFVIDRYQLVEARCAGADAALLIAEILPGDRLRDLVAAAHDIGLQTLVELFDPAHVERVASCGSDLIGVNNRDLRSFVTRLGHTTDLLPQFPEGTPVVSESGIRTREDVLGLQVAGVRAVLIGETLMRAADIGAALRGLRGD